jgi:tight adherence protein C
MSEAVLLLIVFVSVFAAVALTGFALSQVLGRKRLMGRDITSAAATGLIQGPEQAARADNAVNSFDVLSAPHAARSLETRLLHAGFPGAETVAIFRRLRALSMLLAFAVLALVSHAMSPDGTRLLEGLAFGTVGAGLTYVGAGAVLDHLVTRNQRQFRHLFPDFLDLLIVCVDTGLTIESAIERVATEFNKNNSVFGQYLSIINLEVRAGRHIHTALQNFAARTNIEEAKELAMLFRQSQELGASIIVSLRAYSKQMRQIRMIRAEEQANELPVKMLLPLAGFLFPVNLIIVLVPVLIRILGMFVTLSPGGP